MEASRVDRILELLDAGLQSSDEMGFGVDRSTACARCQQGPPVTSGDLCAACRSYLLGNSDAPQTSPLVVDDEVWLTAAADAMGVIVDAVKDMAQSIANAFAAIDIAGLLDGLVGVAEEIEQSAAAESRRRNKEHITAMRRHQRHHNHWSPS